MDVVQGFLLQFGSGIGIGMLYFVLIKSYKKNHTFKMQNTSSSSYQSICLVKVNVKNNNSNNNSNTNNTNNNNNTTTTTTNNNNNNNK